MLRYVIRGILSYDKARKRMERMNQTKEPFEIRNDYKNILKHSVKLVKLRKDYEDGCCYTTHCVTEQTNKNCW